MEYFPFFHHMSLQKSSVSHSLRFCVCQEMLCVHTFLTASLLAGVAQDIRINTLVFGFCLDTDPSSHPSQYHGFNSEKERSSKKGARCLWLSSALE